jgi:arylsulfatase A-like enzyme
LGDEIFPQHGFEEWVSIEDGYCSFYSEGRDQAARSSYHHFLTVNGLEPADGQRFGRSEAARLPETFGKPAFLGREASRFIREHRRHPFVLYVNFLEPHMPFFGPRDNEHDPAEVNLPANFDAPIGENQHLRARLLRQVFHNVGLGGVRLQTEEDWRQLIARYWGLCSLVDTHVGTILHTLEECNLLDNTIIVFTSDHGDMMCSHRLVAKCVMFEEAVRVPLLVRLPGQTQARRISKPISQIDVVPTLLDLLGEAIPSHLQGKSLRPCLESGLEPETEDVFIEWKGDEGEGLPDRSAYREPYPDFLAQIATREEALAALQDPIRTVVTVDGWKFSFSPLGMRELYNLREDPYEISNLAARPEMKRLVGELTGRIGCWQERTGDVG